MDLMEQLIEEVHDYKEYKQMHREAKEEGNHELAFWLDRIAADERSHARWLYEYLCEKGKINEQGRALWAKIDEMPRIYPE